VPSLPPAELRSDFGLIVNLRDAASQPVLRTERDATPLATFTGGYFRQFNGAVSVDGRKIAYWNVPGDQRVPAELRVLDVAKPTDQRIVLTLRTELPEAIVWSSDGNGLLYTVTDTKSGQGVVAEYSALRSVDLIGGTIRELGRSAPRRWLLGTAWNREKGFALGIELDGDTGLAIGYDRYGPSGTQRTTVDSSVVGLASSPDGLRMIGAYGRATTTGPASGPYELRVWSSDDPAHYAALLPDPAWPNSNGWAFRPGTDEIAIWQLNASTLQLLLWDPASGHKTALAPKDIGRFRPDGSAVISNNGYVLEIATGRTAKIDLPTGAFIAALVRFR
jgi:hypothetical protein